MASSETWCTTMHDLAIRAARVVTPDGIETVDVGIDGGAFADIGTNVGPAREDVAAEGCVVLPATIDVHVHFNEPGRASWEGLASGSRALAAGGGASFFDMPLNSEPPLLDAAAFHAKREAAQAKSVADFGLWGGLTPDNLGQLENLFDAGVVGLKAFMSDSGIDSFRAADDGTLLEGMRIAAARGGIVAVHAENNAITRRGAAQARVAGRTDARAWAESRPPVAETEAIARALHLAAETGARLHVVHVSTRAGVELVAEARRRGVDASCETCAHYLHFSLADAEDRGVILKCAPPLRDEVHQVGLREALAAGHIDLIASDHSPAPPELKTGGDWFNVWGGIAGVQHTLLVLLEHVRRGEIALGDVARLTAEAPARRFGLPRKGRIAAGYDADVAIVRPTPDERVVRIDDLHQRHPTSPYVGERFGHRIVRTLRRGETIYAGGTIAAHGKGRLLRPAAS